MSQKRQSQAGNVLLPVTVIGLICSLVLGGLMNHALYLEEAAVEGRLAEIRAYWAAMGHFRYALSRMRHLGFCPNALGCAANTSINDATKVTVLQGYLGEIASLQTWSYPEENAAYFITIAVTGTADDAPARHSFSGHLTMTSTYPSAGVSTVPVLSGAAQRFTPYEIRVCTSLTAAYTNCGNVNNNNNNGRPTGLYSVKRLYRQPSAS